MELKITSNHIKPVKFRIVSGGVQCSNLQMLKDNFSLKDLLREDTRLSDWLYSINEQELAVAVMRNFQKVEKIKSHVLGFVKLIYGKELVKVSSDIDLLNYFKTHNKSVFRRLLSEDINICLYYYYSNSKDEISKKEWIEILRHYPHEEECLRLIDSLQPEITGEAKRKLSNRDNISKARNINYYTQQEIQSFFWRLNVDKDLSFLDKDTSKLIYDIWILSKNLSNKKLCDRHLNICKSTYVNKFYLNILKDIYKDAEIFSTLDEFQQHAKDYLSQHLEKDE